MSESRRWWLGPFGCGYSAADGACEPPWGFYWLGFAYRRVRAYLRVPEWHWPQVEVSVVRPRRRKRREARS